MLAEARSRLYLRARLYFHFAYLDFPRALSLIGATKCPLASALSALLRKISRSAGASTLQPSEFDC